MEMAEGDLASQNRKRTLRVLGAGAGCGCGAVLLMLLAFPVMIFAVQDVGDGPPVQTVTPLREAIVGSWRSKDGATLTFSADGTFVAADMPVGTEPSDDFDAVATDKPELPWGSGTWGVQPVIGGGMGMPGGVQVLVGGHYLELETKGDPSHPTLFAVIGDPDDDDEYVFNKF